MSEFDEYAQPATRNNEFSEFADIHTPQTTALKQFDNYISPPAIAQRFTQGAAAAVPPNWIQEWGTNAPLTQKITDTLMSVPRAVAAPFNAIGNGLSSAIGLNDLLTKGYSMLPQNIQSGLAETGHIIGPAVELGGDILGAKGIMSALPRGIDGNLLEQKGILPSSAQAIAPEDYLNKGLIKNSVEPAPVTARQIFSPENVEGSNTADSMGANIAASAKKDIDISNAKLNQAMEPYRLLGSAKPQDLETQFYTNFNDFLHRPIVDADGVIIKPSLAETLPVEDARKIQQAMTGVLRTAPQANASSGEFVIPGTNTIDPSKVQEFLKTMGSGADETIPPQTLGDLRNMRSRVYNTLDNIKLKNPNLGQWLQTAYGALNKTIYDNIPDAEGAAEVMERSKDVHNSMLNSKLLGLGLDGDGIPETENKDIFASNILKSPSQTRTIFQTASPELKQAISDAANYHFGTSMREGINPNTYNNLFNTFRNTGVAPQLFGRDNWQNISNINDALQGIANPGAIQNNMPALLQKAASRAWWLTPGPMRSVVGAIGKAGDVFKAPEYLKLRGQNNTNPNWIIKDKMNVDSLYPIMGAGQIENAGEKMEKNQ